MTFEEILDQVIALLQRRRRLTYRALKRQFNLDDDYLADLKAELIQGQRLAVDEAGAVLVWTGDTASVVAPSAPAPVQAQGPLTYTPQHLAEKILTSRTALEGERKQVTVLFADVSGFTSISEKLDPEEVHHLMNRAFELMLGEVHRYEGTINQFLGDGVMALFGAPIAHEDHAQRAVHAALGMQRVLRGYQAELQRTQGITFRVRLGLNTGLVVVGSIGDNLRMDYTAVGDTTNLAARMVNMAAPEQILVAEDTHKVVSGYFVTRPLGAQVIKGKAAPVNAYEVVRARGLRTRLEVGAERGLTPFVGRQQELTALQQALERAGTGHGQVVAVVGEAGVGKSRLVYEFVHAHHTSGWLVLASAALSYSKATPYFPVIDLLKRYSHVEEHDDTRTIRAKVTGQVLTLDLALQDTVPALLALLEALPEDSPFLQLDPPQRRQRTLDALKQVVLRESQVQPLLLVFEDLHWIDTETQALLDRLVESLPTACLLLLVNYRPEYQHGWSNKTVYTQLRLDPLPTASADALLQALLGDDPGLAPLQKLLIARTEGNPFFLEEGVRTLMETGVLVGERGAYHLTQALPTIQVPATVQAVLAARIDRLPPAEKRLLQTAAVIGTDVPSTLLQAIADVPEAALHRGLAHLQAAEFLYETRLFPEPDYTFKHALTHEVAYGSLLLERRRVLHAQIVEALEILAGDRQDEVASGAKGLPAGRQDPEQVDRLAQHAVRGQVWDKALQYCRQAGDKALAGSAYQEAVGYLEQALEALTHLPPDRPMLEQAVDLRGILSVALELLGQGARGLMHLREAETLAEGLADHRRLGRVCHRIASTLTQMQDYESALAYCQRAHAIATALGDVDLQVWVNNDMGQIYQDLGDYRQAMAYLQQVLTVLPGEQRSQAFSGMVILRSIVARVHMVLCLSELGRFADGVAQSDEAFQVAETGARPDDRLAVYSGVGYLHVRQGTLHQAIPLLERAVALSQDANIPIFYSISVPFLALAYALAGRATDALAVLGQVRGNTGVPILALTCGEVYLRAGCMEEAHRLAQRGLAHTRHHKKRGDEARVLWLLSEIAMHHDPPDVAPAEAHYQQSLALAEELGMRPLQAHCHLGLGTLYIKTGQREQARADLSTAIDLYRAMEMLLWLPQAEVALAQVEGQ